METYKSLPEGLINPSLSALANVPVSRAERLSNPGPKSWPSELIGAVANAKLQHELGVIGSGIKFKEKN